MNRKKLKEIIIQNIINNKKEYIIISLLFFVGILIGVFYINYLNEDQTNSNIEFFSKSIETIKNVQNYDYLDSLKTSIINNIIIAALLWFLGTTIIGIPIMCGVIAYKGFGIGYTISSAVISLGTSKGIAFILASLLCHNIIFIPVTIAIGVSGLKLYKSIFKDRKRQNIKLEIIRHTMFSIIMLILLMLSSIIETFVSTNILLCISKYL